MASRLTFEQAHRFLTRHPEAVLLDVREEPEYITGHARDAQLLPVDELTEEKARYHADYQRDQAKIRELDRNPKAMEKIARERYFMKTDDEDIFVLRENEDLSSDQTDSNEKAE